MELLRTIREAFPSESPFWFVTTVAVGAALIFGSLAYAIDRSIQNRRPAVEQKRTSGSTREERAEAYRLFAEHKRRREGLYGQGMFLQLTISALTGDMNQMKASGKDLRGVQASIAKYANSLNEDWNPKHTDVEATLQSILARIRVSYVITSELRQLMDRVSKPYVIDVPESPAHKDQEAKGAWLQAFVDDWNEQFDRECKQPMEELEKYLAEKVD